MLLVKGEIIPSASSVLGLSLGKVCQLFHASAKLCDDFVMWANIPQCISFNRMHKSEAFLNGAVTKPSALEQYGRSTVGL